MRTYKSNALKNYNTCQRIWKTQKNMKERIIMKRDFSGCFSVSVRRASEAALRRAGMGKL